VYRPVSRNASVPDVAPDGPPADSEEPNMRRYRRDNGNDTSSAAAAATLLLLLLTAAAMVDCRVRYDLYLDADDMERLIGLAARLYYVRSGRPNANAARYGLEVPASVNAVNLTWSATGGGTLFYRIAADVDPDSAVAAPKLTNAAHEGAVPEAPSMLSLSVQCTRTSADAADVRLSVRTSEDDAAAGWLSSDVVVIVFRKFCADEQPPRDIPAVNDTSSLSSSSPSSSSAAVATTATTTAVRDDMTTGPSSDAAPRYYDRAFFYHATAAASSLVALAIICCLTTAYHRGKARDLMIIKGFQNDDEVNVFLKSALNSSNKFNQKRHRHQQQQQQQQQQQSCGSRAREKDLHECIAELSIQRQRVRLQKIELEGTFGRVYRGMYTDTDGTDEEVFVKTVTDQASAVQISMLLHEGMAMYGLSHRNVLTIQAVSVEQHVEPFLLYPYNNNKNLKKFLQNCKTSESVSYTLTTREIIDMTLQIINGMNYLHKNKHLHRDVAARNCLVDHDLRVQIADNALSRDLFPGDYHCLGDNKNRPIKWMSVESLEHKKFSTASDIWSFGVLMWELLTLCQQPYADIDPFEMSAYLQDGFRLAQPINCPDELFTVMACCWALAPNERPTFSQLEVFIYEFNNRLVKFV